MTDILTKLAALTAKDTASPVPACPFCGSLDGSTGHDDGRFWWHCDCCGATGPALTRYSDEDEPCWESRPREQALIALVQEAAQEIERLRGLIGLIRMKTEWRFQACDFVAEGDLAYLQAGEVARAATAYLREILAVANEALKPQEAVKSS